MRKLISILFSNFLCICAFAQTTGVHWELPLNVGVGTTHNNIYPRLTLVVNDVPLVIWEDNSPATIYTAHKMGSGFSAPIAINAGVSPYVVSWTGPEIASSGDTAFVVFMTAIANSKSYAVRSIDGGMTFSDTTRVDNETGRLASFPNVAVLPGGNPLIAYMGSDTLTMADPRYTITRSLDGGISFLPAIEPVVTGEACDCCPSDLVVSPGATSLLFRNNISNLREMWTSLSTDDGASFPVSANIDTTNWIISSCPSSAPSGLIIGDSLVYSWMSDGTGDARVYIGTMNILDQQMGQHRQVYPVGLSSQNYPVLAGKGDTLGLVWLGYNASAQDVLFTWSTTGAAGLGAVVDTITKGSSGNQSRPDLKFNNGRFHVVYSNSVGAQVQYLEGNFVSNLSVNELSAPAVSLSASAISGFIEVSIHSSDEQKGELTIMNALGQQLKKRSLSLNKGENRHSIFHQFDAGVYFVVYAAGDGKTYSRKITVTR